MFGHNTLINLGTLCDPQQLPNVLKEKVMMMFIKLPAVFPSSSTAIKLAPHFANNYCMTKMHIIHKTLDKPVMHHSDHEMQHDELLSIDGNLYC